MKKTHESFRHIGFFQFYDSTKGFGFLATNRVLFDDVDDENDEVIGIYVDSKQVSSKEILDAAMYPPFSEDDWVTFEISKTPRNFRAMHLHPANTDEALRIALKYYTENPVIEGYDKKHKKHYNKHVLFKVLESFLKINDNNSEEFIKILSTCLSDISEKDKFLSDLLSDKIYLLVKNSFLNFSDGFDFSSLPHSDIIINKVIEKLISKNDWECMSKLWCKGFVQKEQYPVVCKGIIHEDSQKGEEFLLNLGYADLFNIFAGADLTSLSWNLAKAVYSNVGNNFQAVFPDIEKCSDPLLFFLYLSGQKECLYSVRDWETLLKELNDCDEHISIFLTLYAPDAEDAGVIEKIAKQKNIRSYALKMILPSINHQETTVASSQIFTQIILNAEFVEREYDWDLLASCLEHRISLEFCYPAIRKKLTEDDTISSSIQFFKNLKVVDANRLFSSVSPKKINWTLAKILYEQYKNFFADIFSLSNDLPDTLLLLLYVSGKSGCLRHISNWGTLLKDVDSAFLSHFAKLLSGDTTEDASDALSLMRPSDLACILRSLGDANLFKSLCGFARIDETIALSAARLFPESEKAKDFIRRRWRAIRSDLSYTVFDLESDGEAIWEFAFLQEQDRKTQKYEGENDLSSLLQQLNNARIIVGHNVRQWDLPILEKRGLTTNAFVWDTLEMEFLLNPCRYAYSLRAKHKADKDAELADDLFWSQLYTMAQREDLVRELQEFLPDSITELLTKLRTSPYRECFKEFTERSLFFKDRFSLSRKTAADLKYLANTASKGRVLLIAPRSLWPELALHLPLSFPSLSMAERGDYRMISKDLVKQSPPKTAPGRAFLLRFCEKSVTPILANIPKYLRADQSGSRVLQLTDADFERYAVPCRGSIDCVDMDVFDDPSCLSGSYFAVATVSSEDQDRLHAVKVGRNLSFNELMRLDTCYPFKMSLAGCVSVRKEDFERLFVKAFGRSYGKYTANMWIERQKNGTFALYKNFFFDRAFEGIFSRFRVSEAIKLIIEWERNLPATVSSPVIVRCKKRRGFDASEYRLNPDSPYRGRYWIAQIGFLIRIHEIHPDLPLVFVTDTLEENETHALRAYIESRGLAVVREKGLKNLDLAFRKKNSVLLVTQDDFACNIGAFRTDMPFCVVWDNMGTERLRVMWRNLPFAIASTEDSEESEERQHHTTVTECIEAAWPLYVHYGAMVAANSAESCFYVLDPAFDACPNLAKALDRVQFREFDLWKNKADWEAASLAAQEFFAAWPGGRDDTSIDIEVAKTHIRTMLIDGSDWKDGQEEIVDFMLQKKGDSIVSIPTGGGKSVLFQGPALYLGYFSKKLSIVISPLRALMQDQVANLQQKGFGACVDYISGDLSRAEVLQIYRRLRSGGVTLLYVTPERFRVKSFMNVLRERMEHDDGLEYAVFDEAHCIAQWGNDFRPDYLNTYQMCAEWKKNYDISIALFSATITAQEENEYTRILPHLTWLGQKREEYSPVRRHIEMQFEFIRQNTVDARFEKILEYMRTWNLNADKSRMIVFCRKREDCENYAANLDGYCGGCDKDDTLRRYEGHIGFFHGAMEQGDRSDAYSRFSAHDQGKKEDNALYVLFATKAFGMGMDIPNIHYLMHLSPPSVLEDYLQEVGRAGRSQKMYKDAMAGAIPAVCLISEEDFKTHKTLLQNSLLAWSHLSEARKKIIAYLEQFHTLEECQTNALVVPWNIWLKDPQKPNEITASRLVFHWLERTGRIKLGYLMPAHLDITLKDNVSAPVSGDLLNVFHVLLKYIKMKGKMGQIPIQEPCMTLHISVATFMDLVLELERRNILTIHVTIYSDFTNRRYGEIKYALQNNTQKYLALHIYFETLEYILRDFGLHRDYDISDRQHERYTKLLDEACIYDDEEIICERKKSKDEDKDKEEYIKYMPWKKYEAILPDYAVTKYETFRKDIVQFGLRRMFLILAHTPGISFKDDRDFQRIHIDTFEWREFLPSLEADCLMWLSLLNEKEPLEPFRWTALAREAGLLSKGFDYFCIVLTILGRLGYIRHSPLLPIGIELFTTEKTAMALDSGTDKNSPLYPMRRDFDEQEQVKKTRLVCMNVFSYLQNKDDRNAFIRQYFQCSDIEAYFRLLDTYAPKTTLDFEEILKELNDEALSEAEDKLNDEQADIYNESVQEHINVMAGPGSGKTHVLTLRCARLIYKEKVDPGQVLVLAYNRAVVEELRNRLNTLFARLGLSRFASRISVYTFHGLARRCLGERLDDVTPSQWDEKLRNFLEHNRNEFRTKFPQIRHILIDEFQDITQTRFEYLSQLHEIFPDAKFFTIGDINQSIYGFDRIPEQKSLSPEKYAQFLDPRFYYEKWKTFLEPRRMTMFINYRSYQKILDFSARYLPKDSEMPRSSEYLTQHEPQDSYVVEECLLEEDLERKPWLSKIHETVLWAKKENDSSDSSRRIRTIAVFFRTNAEVSQAYSSLCNDMKNDMKEGVRLRIQGQSVCELWRKREFYEVINWFSTALKDRVFELDKEASKENRNKTYGDIVSVIDRGIEKYKEKWDVYYLEVLKALIHNYVDSVRSDEKTHTFQEIAEYIKDLAGKDDGGQIYKIYDEYYKEDKKISVVLTTMHKVKGLEFDAVITVPSTADMPLKRNDSRCIGLTAADLADIEEEKRLMYVACTRAKKKLFVYTGPREKAVLEGKLYKNNNINLGYIYDPNPGLDQYYLSYSAQDYTYNNVKINDRLKTVGYLEEVRIEKQIRNSYVFYNIIRLNDRKVLGQLSKGSNIVKGMKRNNQDTLEGFFVSDVVAWTYKDTQHSDEKNTTSFSEKWCKEAREKGFVYIAIISGIYRPC